MLYVMHLQVILVYLYVLFYLNFNYLVKVRLALFFKNYYLALGF